MHSWYIHEDTVCAMSEKQQVPIMIFPQYHKGPASPAKLPIAMQQKSGAWYCRKHVTSTAGKILH